MDFVFYLVVAAIVGFAVMQFLPFVQARRARGRPAPDLGPWLTAQQQAQRRLLLYFWSPTCGMCRTMTPIIDTLAAGRDDIVKLNVNETLDLVRRLGVMATPTLVTVNGGRIEQVLVGSRSERQIRALLGD